MYYGERFNGYTHLVGTALAVAGAAGLLAIAAAKADPLRLASFAVYGTSLVLCFLASTLYHSTRGRVKSVFRKLDHCSIYLLIAGSWTPFALVALRDTAVGVTLFVAVWALALLGILQECWIARGRRLLSLAIYLLMGWLAIFALSPLVDALSWYGFMWLLTGGLIYTGGIVFYLYDFRRHWHGFWHLCVLAGSATHYGAVLLFVA